MDGGERNGEIWEIGEVGKLGNWEIGAVDGGEGNREIRKLGNRGLRAGGGK